MKYLLIIFVVLVWLGSGAALAIDKHKKDDKQGSGNQVELTDPDKPRPEARRQSKDRKPEYDDFIDRDNDGIDDRARRKGDSPSAGEQDRKSSDEKKPAPKRKSSDSEKPRPAADSSRNR